MRRVAWIDGPPMFRRVMMRTDANRHPGMIARHSGACVHLYPMMPLSRRRKIVYGLVTMTLVTLVLLIGLLGADIYAHWRTQNVAGVNVWGYRGAPISAKRAGETRVAMFGGSTVYGWGLPAHESIASFLEQRLNASAAGRRFSVVNLGAPGQGAFGFVTDLADFEYLDYDIVCLYEGYNDIGTITIARPATITCCGAASRRCFAGPATTRFCRSS